MDLSVLAEPAHTGDYFLAGIIVIFTGLFIYWVSLVIRARRLKKDEDLLNDLENKDQEKNHPVS
jgi:hypothetical protein